MNSFFYFRSLLEIRVNTYPIMFYVRPVEYFMIFQGRYANNSTRLANALRKIIMTAIGNTVAPSSCLRPCHELNVGVKHVATLRGPKINAIRIMFNPTMIEIRHNLAYGPFDLLVEIGSALGLWTGLSALGVLDLLLNGLAGMADIYIFKDGDNNSPITLYQNNIILNP